MFRLINNDKTENKEVSHILEKTDDQLTNPGLKPSSILL